MAGLGHEINNPLAIAQGNIQKLKSLVENANIFDDAIDKCFKNIDQSTKRISNVLLGLRSIARFDSMEIRPFDVVDSISKDLNFVEGTYKEQGIAITKDFQTSKAIVSGSLGRFQQATLNLLSNAKDALKNSSKKNIKVTISKDDDHVKIVISDSGEGMSLELQNRIFKAL